MGTYTVLIIIAAILLATWGTMKLKLREMEARARFFECLQRVWEEISRGHLGYAHPCVDEGMTYINSVFFGGWHRDCVRTEVYRLLDSSYHNYLWGLHERANRILAKNEIGADKDMTLHHFFVQNRHWLEYDEKYCDWYDAATFEPPKTGKSPNRARKLVLEQRDSCEERLATKRATLEKRLEENERERRRLISADQASKGFWACMAEIGPTYRPGW